MKKEELKNLKQKDLTELKEELGKGQKELFELQMAKMTGKLKNLKAVFFQRKRLAVIKTIIKEKEYL